MNYERGVPKSVTALQEQIEVLKWAQAALKVVPNLPNGKLKDTLELDLASIINGSKDKRVLISDMIRELDQSTRSLQQTLKEKSQAKKLHPTDITLIQELCSQISEMLAQVINQGRFLNS